MICEYRTTISDYLSAPWHSGKKLVFFGAGKYCRRFVNRYCGDSSDGKQLPMPDYICDNSSALWGSEINGSTIYPPKRLLEERPEDLIIIVTAGFMSVLGQLYEMDLYYYPVIAALSVEAFYFHRKHRWEIEATRELLADEKSQNAYELLWQCRINGSVQNAMIYDLNPYYGNDLIPVLDDDAVIVGGGAYDGGHIDRALALNPNIHYYAFEPGKKYYEMLSAKYGNNPNIHIIPKAMYSRDCTLGYDATSELAAYVYENPHGGKSAQVEATTIDACVVDTPVSMIWLDVEGSELEALKGSTQTILKYHPILCVCVYHKIEDYLEIAQYISEHYPAYRLYFRQHSCFYTESVLYAIAGDK